MTFVAIVAVILQASIFLTVFGFGLASSLDDLVFLLRRPSLLARSLLSMYIIIPLFAVAVTSLFRFRPAVEIAVVALSLSPVPPLLPHRELEAGGTASYAFGLLFTAAVLSIVLTPLGIEAVARVAGFPAQTATAIVAILKIILVTVIAPFILGVIVHYAVPAAGERIAGPVSRGAQTLLLIIAVVVVIVLLPSIASLTENGTILVFAAFVAVGLVAGHFLGGPDPRDRKILALSSAVRHPGVAMTVGMANFPQERLIPAAVILYLLVNVIVTLPYLAWGRRRGSHSAEHDR